MTEPHAKYAKPKLVCDFCDAFVHDLKPDSIASLHFRNPSCRVAVWTIEVKGRLKTVTAKVSRLGPGRSLYPFMYASECTLFIILGFVVFAL